MNAPAARWKLQRNSAANAPYLVRVLEILQAGEGQPRLFRDLAGNEAVVISCRVLVASLAMAGLPMAKGATEALGSEDDTDSVALLSMAKQTDAKSAIASLAEMVHETGGSLGFVALTDRDAAGTRPDTLGLTPVADGMIGIPDATMAIYRRVPDEVELRKRLLEDRPNPIPEPPGNLRRRAGWFQRRTGRPD